MKNLFLGLIIGVGSILLSAAYINKEESSLDSADSGSIAMVHVIEKATRVIIRTTIEGQVSNAVNIDAGYVEEEDMVNFQPVLDELTRLQGLGYELQSSSLAAISYGKKTTMRPYHSFILVKR